MRPPGAVLFDIDGTLVDSNYLHVDAWLRALQAVGHPVDAWRIHRVQGMGSAQLLATLWGGAADQVGSQAKQQHSDHYQQSSEQLRVFDGARELVAAVAQRGAKAVLATSAAAEELELLRSILDVEDAVAEITAAEDVDAAKPAPDLVPVALQRAGVSAVAVYDDCRALLRDLDASPLAAVWS